MNTIYIKNDKQVSGKNLLDHLRTMDLDLIAPCGGKGLCGKCMVKILMGPSVLSTPYSENEVISQEEWIKGYRLACRIEIQEDLEVQLMETYSGRANILTDGYYSASLDPLVKKRYFQIDKPDIEDQRADTDRIESIANGIDILDIDLIKELSYTLNRFDYKVTLAYTNDEIISIEGGDTAHDCYGLALDIGTTTIAGVLINLNTGEELGVYSSINPQKQYGDDVISRIDYTMENKHGLKKLSSLLVQEINRMLTYFENQYHIRKNNIYHLNLVGNTIMIHMLVGAPVGQIAASPFNPVFTRLKDVKAVELGIDTYDKALVTSLPLSAGYIGADTLSCITACGMAQEQELSLMIDIGTNGEIALGNQDKIVTCATAAGPAFEGGHIECGMGGVRGAINTVKVDEHGLK
ncbi:MAG TPA: ASKHA domain-containing protein, partial [Bacillota bacterium]|nr:ASKHA domain-containing protein [Bacillota bacterium]